MVKQRQSNEDELLQNSCKDETELYATFVNAVQNKSAFACIPFKKKNRCTTTSLRLQKGVT